MAKNSLSLDVWPVGSGPFMAVEYDPDRRHVLVRNPNYHGATYPCEGAPGDRGNGFYGAYFRDLDGNKFCAFKMG